MTKLEKVTLYYEKGLWDEKRVHDAVLKGWITEEEAAAILAAGEAQPAD